MLKNRATMLFDFLKWSFRRLPLVLCQIVIVTGANALVCGSILLLASITTNRQHSYARSLIKA